MMADCRHFGFHARSWRHLVHQEAASCLSPNLPIAFVSVEYDDEDTVAAHQPPGNTTYGTHNFRRPNHVITEYDDDVFCR